MAAKWNRIARSPTALRAESIRTEPGFHLVKSWNGRLRKQRRKRSENGFNQLNSNHLAHSQIRPQAASLLQLTVVNVLLVRSFSSSVGATQPCRPCLASASRYFRSHNSVRCGDRLFCKLGQESHLSLQHHRLDISGRCSGLSANGYWRDPN